MVINLIKIKKSKKTLIKPASPNRGEPASLRGEPASPNRGEPASPASLDARQAKRGEAGKLSLAEKTKIEKEYQQQIKEVLGLEAKAETKKAAEKTMPPVIAVNKKNSTPPSADKNLAEVKAPDKIKEKAKVKENIEVLEQDLNEIREAVLAQLKSANLEELAVALPKESDKKQATLKIKKISQKKSVSEPVTVIIEPSGKKHKLLTFLLRLILILVFLGLLVSAGIYLGGWDKPAIKKITEFIPYPVLQVNGHFISVKTYFEDLAALKEYLARLGIAANETEIKSQVMKSLIEKEIIQELGQAKGITVSSTDLEQQLDFMATDANYSKEEVEKLVKDLYGWDLAQYTEKIIKPLILAQKVEQNFNESSDIQQIKKQIDAYSKQLADDPDKFGGIAGLINQDNTKYVKGDLGWFALGELVPELELALMNLEPGQISPVVESRYGFHLIKLDEKLIDERTGQTTFHAAHIFLKRPSFADYLNEQIKKAKVLTLIKI